MSVNTGFENNWNSNISYDFASRTLDVIVPLKIVSIDRKGKTFESAQDDYLKELCLFGKLKKNYTIVDINTKCFDAKILGFKNQEDDEYQVDITKQLLPWKTYFAGKSKSKDPSKEVSMEIGFKITNNPYAPIYTSAKNGHWINFYNFEIKNFYVKVEHFKTEFSVEDKISAKIKNYNIELLNEIVSKSNSTNTKNDCGHSHYTTITTTDLSNWNNWSNHNNIIYKCNYFQNG